MGAYKMVSELNILVDIFKTYWVLIENQLHTKG